MERRDFLKVLGTAAGAGAAAACSPNAGGVPPERMLPYVIADPEIVPGISTYYRTTCRECPAGCGMDVRTREGRALKAEGNPLSPISPPTPTSYAKASEVKRLRRSRSFIV